MYIDVTNGYFSTVMLSYILHFHSLLRQLIDLLSFHLLF